MKKKHGGNPGARYRLTDILWWTRREDVFKEIASILDLDSADTNTPGWFQLRTKASKNILNAMAEDEREALEKEAERMQNEGLPPDVQKEYVHCCLPPPHALPMCVRRLQTSADCGPTPCRFVLTISYKDC